MRIGKKHSQRTKTNISRGQLGNRRGTKKRKYKEDEILPKYITGYRVGGVLIGYKVENFPIGIGKAEYAKPKYFRKKIYTLEENYQLAQQYLNSLKEKYADVLNEIEKQRKEFEEEKNKNHFEVKKKRMTDKLPEYIYPLYKGNRMCGYRVKNVPTHDNNIPSCNRF